MLAAVGGVRGFNKLLLVMFLLLTIMNIKNDSAVFHPNPFILFCFFNQTQYQVLEFIRESYIIAKEN